MPRQESILFGGLAKVLITPPIETTVYKRSVTHSASKFVNNPSFGVELVTRTAQGREIYAGSHWNLTTGFTPFPDDVKAFLLRRWLQTVIVRSFQLRQTVTTERVTQDVDGTEAFRVDCEHALSLLQGVDHLSRKRYRLRRPEWVYPFISRWPGQTIHFVRNRLREA